MKRRRKKRNPEFFFQMTGRASVVAKTYPDVFAPGTAAGDGIAELESQQQDYVRLKTQSGEIAVRLSVESKWKVFEDSKAVMETVSRVSKNLGLLQFFMPKDRSAATLVSVARMWLASPELQETFAKRGYAEYLEGLKESTRRMIEAIDGKTFSHITRTEAFRAIEKLHRAARETFHRLDAVVRLKLRDNPAVLAVWESATRVDSAPVHNTPAGSAEPPAGPAEPPAEGAARSEAAPETAA